MNGIVDRITKLKKRVGWLWTAKKRARRLGFSFQRRAGFQVPQSIIIGGKRISLAALEEGGLVSDFIGAFLEDTYRFERIAQSVGSRATIVDVGANVGFCSLAARHAFADADIFAFEPNQKIMEVLKSNTQPSGIKVFEAAVGREDGFISLSEGSESNQIKISGAGDIPQKSFRSVVQQVGGNIDVLKLDCEGAEWDLFSDKDPWKHVTWLTMEYHLWAKPGSTHAGMAGEMDALGFELLEQVPDQQWGALLARRRNA